MTATCPNPDCAEHGAAKDCSQVPVEFTLFCGTCGAECERPPR
jgi:hypothetical protein